MSAAASRLRLFWFNVYVPVPATDGRKPATDGRKWRAEEPAREDHQHSQEAIQGFKVCYENVISAIKSINIKIGKRW